MPHGRAGPGDGLECPVGPEEAQSRGVHPEDGQHAPHDPVGDLRDVEALGQHARALRQLLGLAAAARRLGEETRVAHRHCGLRGEGGQELPVVLGGQVLFTQVEGEDSQEVVARHDRDAGE